MGYHKLLETSKILEEMAANRESKMNAKTKALLQKESSRAEELMEAKEYHEFARERHAAFKEKIYNEMTGTALKAVYVSALQKCTDMTTENYALAEHLVDQFIQEQGGAREIMLKNVGKSSLLDTILKEAENAAEESLDDAETEDTDAEEFDEVPQEPKEKMFDDLEKDGDVDSAVEIISNRISDAEEEFIKKNSEDKQKIENIVSDINDRIEAIKGDRTIDQEDKDQLEQEQTILCKRKINEVYAKRPHNVFETMVQELTTAIVKDKDLKVQYTTEDGSLDMGKIVDSTKCMYGFLEFVNTINLANVDETYIKEILEEI